MCCSQVIQWIEEHGETFLKKHTGVGKSLVKAEALLRRHEEFENIAQVRPILYINTHTHIDKTRNLSKAKLIDCTNQLEQYALMVWLGWAHARLEV